MRRPALALRILLLIAASSGIVRAAEPRPSPLARYFPRKDLVAYIEFDGLDAHAEAWKKTAAYRILNETGAGSMLASVASQILAEALPPGQDGLPTGDDVAAVARQLVRSGFAFAINRKVGDPAAKPSSIGLVLRGAGRGPLVPAIKMILARSGLPPEALSTLDKPGGRKLTILGAPEGPCVAWWIEGDDLALSLIEARYAETMMAVLDGREPDAVEHPARLALASRADGFEPVGLGFFDARALPEMPPEAVMFGLDGIERFEVRWGYQGEALVSDYRLLAPAPRRGVLAMFDQPIFDARSLPPLPGGVGSFTAISVDPGKVYDQLAALARQADPKGLSLFPDMAAELFWAATGRGLREDLLASIGPRMVLAEVPTRVFVSSSPLDGFARTLARVPRLSLLVELTDRARFVEDLEALAKWANGQFPIPNDPKANPGRPASPLVRRLKNVDVGYEVALSPTYWPLPAGYRPSIVVGDRYASLGTSPDVARQALRTDGDLGEPLARAIASLPTDLTVLSVEDTRNSALPEILANIPSMIQWWGLSLQSGSGAFPLGVLNGLPVRIEIPPGPLPMIASAPSRIEVATAPAIAVPTPAEVPQAVPAPATAPPITSGPVPIAPSGPAVAPVAPPGVTPEEASPTPGPVLRLRLDPDEIPTPDEIRPFLFPATHTMSADPSGFRIMTREAFPSWNPIGLVPLGVSMALPAFQSWREESERERLSANLRKVGLVLSNYQETKGQYPPPATLDKAGKPLLSWRVELLPHLGFQSLYDEFHRDEPWDSPHNKTLLERMPPVFSHPDFPAEPGFTFYRGVTGKGAFFDPALKEGVAIHLVTDGTSNTLALVEAKEAVPWTRPGTEIPFEPGPMPPLLGGHEPGRFLALFLDGQVKLIPETVSPQVLRSLATRDGGEVVSADSF